MSTIQSTVAVPQVTRLVTLEQQISVLREQQQELLATILSDCEFMDVPVLRLLAYEIDEPVKPTPGDVCHVVFGEEEATGYVRTYAHRASTCNNWMCALTERTKYPKHAHVGRRYWATPQPDHVLVGVESFIDERMWGRSPQTRFTLVPVSQSRIIRRAADVNEKLMEMDA